MTSRLTALAAAFAVLAAASLTYAAGAHQAAAASTAGAKEVRVVHLDTVVVTGKRANAATSP